MADDRATLTIKLGGNEVRYEARREAVEAQLEQVLGRLLREAPAGVQVELADESQTSTPSSPAAPPPAVPSPAPPPAAPEITEAQLLPRLYAITKGGRLRLRKLPDRTADALLLVLYGMRKLQDRKWVHAPGMTSAARASGARFDRADKLLAACPDLIEGFGHRRAKRYRLTAAGREHCARLVRSLVGPSATGGGEDDEQTSEPVVAEPPRIVEVEDEIPERVTTRWDGELLTASETAELLGVGVTEVGKLRYRWELLGLPGGTRKRRRYFVPAFQIDADAREIYPQVRKANQLVSRLHTSWGIAKWWSSVEPKLRKKPMELIGTPDADAVVRAAEARFVRRE